MTNFTRKYSEEDQEFLLDTINNTTKVNAEKIVELDQKFDELSTKFDTVQEAILDVTKSYDKLVKKVNILKNLLIATDIAFLIYIIVSIL